MDTRVQGPRKARIFAFTAGLPKLCARGIRWTYTPYSTAGFTGWGSFTSTWPPDSKTVSSESFALNGMPESVGWAYLPTSDDCRAATCGQACPPYCPQEGHNGRHRSTHGRVLLVTCPGRGKGDAARNQWIVSVGASLLRPIRGGLSKRILSTGFVAPAWRWASLHPWLHSSAPLEPEESVSPQRS
jgi:hypothetical protein